MATTFEYFPFDTGPGSNSDEVRWGTMLSWMRTTGILTINSSLNDSDGDLFVAPDTGLQIEVYEGTAWVQGFYFNASGDPFAITIATNSSGFDRIDLVTLQLDLVGNAIYYVVVEGTPSASPVAPSPQQDSDYWQLPLAEVYVANGASVIDSGDITDERVISTQGGNPIPTPYCQVIDTTGQAWDNDTTAHMTFNTNLEDPLGMHSTSSDTDRINILQTGLYALNLSFQFTETVAGPVYFSFILNGSTIISAGGIIDLSELQNMSTIVPLEAADYVSAQINNQSGDTVTADYISPYSPMFSVCYVGTLG